LGLAAFALFLVVLVWGGRAIFQRVETSTEPAPPPKSEVKLPPAGGPPLNAVTQPAPPTRPAAPATRVVSPATGPAFKAPVREDRYQLLVATYATYDQARTLKDRIRAKKLPATVYRVKSKKKTYFIVKAGPFSGKKRAEDAARRLKKEERLPNTPKLVKIKATTVKPTPRKPR